jgi:hypothetical protein
MSVPAPDFTQLARRPSDRLAIVAHVYGTANLQETEYLEWKSAYDLSKRPGAAAAARQMIGMANRDDASGARHAEGHAYILIGVEPGSVPGVPQWDAAEIESWLRRFMEDELRYDIHYVAYDGVQVLFLTIDPPRAGDPIYALQSASEDPETGKSLAAGTIYVRHGSSTTPQTPEDIRRLAKRAGASATSLDLDVRLDPSNVEAINGQLLTSEHRDRTLDGWREEMVALLPDKEPGSWGTFAFQRPIDETRSQTGYVSEVDLYVQKLKANDHLWWAVVADEWLKADRSILGVSIANGSAENYEDTVVELTFGLPRAYIHLDVDEVNEVMPTPGRPRKWGVSQMYSLADRIVPINRAPEPEIEPIDDRTTLVRYPELRVRPHTTHHLEPLLLALGPAHAGRVIPVRWRVTASNTKSDLSADIELLVPGTPEEAQRPAPQDAGAQEDAA